jgi:imidazole glycerol-phosphate synthase subunit HisF
LSSNIRIIPRLDIKGQNLIKGIHLEGLRVMGNPNDFAKLYYNAGADEIIYMDVVASLYGRNNLHDIIKSTVKDIFIPITVGGGIKNLDDIDEILRSGAEKVAINTAITRDPEFITRASRRFGSQCIVASIEAKQNGSSWEVMVENGREKTNIDAIQWAEKLEKLGAGEILITSIDMEGTCKGFDNQLIKNISSIVNIPVIASGGMGSPLDGVKVINQSEADAVAIANILHYKKYTLHEIRKVFLEHNIKVREYNEKNKHN